MLSAGTKNDACIHYRGLYGLKIFVYVNLQEKLPVPKMLKEFTVHEEK